MSSHHIRPYCELNALGMHCQHEHGHVGMGGEDRRCGDFATAAGQVQVHQHDLRPNSLGDLDGELRGSRLTDDLDG